MKLPHQQVAFRTLVNPLLIATLLVTVASHAQVTVPPITLPQVTLPVGGKNATVAPAPAPLPKPPNSAPAGKPAAPAAAPVAAPVVATPLPATINYQGFLTDQKTGVPVNASLTINFKIYDALTGGNLLYSEDQFPSVSNGVVNAQIGSNTPFPATLAFDKPYWLEVKVDGGTLSPRQSIASSAFARSAGSLPSRVGGNTSVGDRALGSFNSPNIAQPQNGNSAFGWSALPVLTSGGANTAVGSGTFAQMNNGSNNIAIGFHSGSNQVSGFGNIYIGDWGFSESDTIRIGTNPSRSRTFIGGIRDVAPALGRGRPVVIDATGQLGNVSDLEIAPGGLVFGNKLGQMLNLWGSQYGIGVQNQALYFRSDTGFQWYWRGAHNDAWGNPGTGGSVSMTLDGTGLVVNGTLASSSDRNAKENFSDIDPSDVLAKVAKLPLQTWNYRNDDHKVKHIGPVAQDFQAAFTVGADDKHIATVDADGVALAAIQGLYRLVQDKETELAQLKSDRNALLARVEALESSNREQMALLKQTIDRLLAQDNKVTQVVRLH